MMNFSLVELAQVILADIFLSGDNAIIIGMAAAGLSEKFRKRVIFWGLALAAGFRIIFAAAASFVIQIPGILIFGGLLLAFVCWRFFKEIRHAGTKTDQGMKTDLSGKLSEKQQFSQALFTIAVADISMSLDNVVAVAAIAREDTALLIFGLVLAIVLMAFFATFIMRVMTKFPWLSWVGLIFLVYLTIKMLVDGWIELLHIL
ncbi:MAG: YjbE family putative metal transport protein [Paracoccaceae bacterium]